MQKSTIIYLQSLNLENYNSLRNSESDWIKELVKFLAKKLNIYENIDELNK